MTAPGGTGRGEAGLPVSSLLDLTGQVAGVTGAASGIGQASARRLAEAGATVYGADVRFPGAAPPAPGWPAQLAVGLDVTDPASVEGLARAIGDTHGRLDIWVNAAGIFPRHPVLDLPLDDWREVFAVNVEGTLLCAQQAARLMTPHGGVIVNVASTVAIRVDGNSAHYRASKAAIVALTQNLAIELAPDIRALAVCPGLTLTDGVKKLQPAGLDRYLARLPLNRGATPDDVARVVLFAASPLASYMTGSCLFVDRGLLAR